jgi:prepilin signal peptidase PulO-like enzyme (type II secretory pathway)
VTPFTIGIICFTLAATWRIRWKRVTIEPFRRSRALTLAACGVPLGLALAGRSDCSLAIALSAVAVCGITDLATGLIFDVVTFPALSATLLAACMGGHLLHSAIGASICGGGLLALHLGTRGRGLGLGDVKLASVIGAGLGGVSSIEAIGCAFVLGALVAIPAMVMRRIRQGESVAFGPYLAAGTAVVASMKALGA